MLHHNGPIRALLIVEALANSSEPLSLNELIHTTGIPKSSLIRHLHSLSQAEFIIRLPEQLGYTIGTRSLRLSANALHSTRFSRSARAILKKLVAKINESCNLTILAEDSVRYLVRVESDAPWNLQLYVQPNTPVPLHCTASGKLFLAHLALIEQKAYLHRLELKAFTKNSITDVSVLKTELETSKRQGFGIDNEEFVTGMAAIAVPIYDPKDSSKVLATVACHAVTARTSLSKLLSYRPVMAQAATEIATLLQS